MKFTQAIAKEDSKYDILSHSSYVTILSYLADPHSELWAIFLGATVCALGNLLHAAYGRYKTENKKLSL